MEEKRNCEGHTDTQHVSSAFNFLSTACREDLWFDDVAVDIVGGEVVAKQPLRHNMSGCAPTELVTGSDNKCVPPSLYM